MPEQRLPAGHGDDHEDAIVLLKPVEVHGGADTHLQPVEYPTPLPSHGRSLLSLFEHQTGAGSLPGCHCLLPSPCHARKALCALLKGSASISSTLHIFLWKRAPRLAMSVLLWLGEMPNHSRTSPAQGQEELPGSCHIPATSSQRQGEPEACARLQVLLRLLSIICQDHHS